MYVRLVMQNAIVVVAVMVRSFVRRIIRTDAMSMTALFVRCHRQVRPVCRSVCLLSQFMTHDSNIHMTPAVIWLFLDRIQ